MVCQRDNRLKNPKSADGFGAPLGYDRLGLRLTWRGSVMLLHCEIEGTADEYGALGWLRAGTLESLVEVNESCLELLIEEARSRGAGTPLLRQVDELWRLLDAPTRRRAAAVPYLLLDAGFAEPLRWRPAVGQVGDAGGAVYAAYFTVPAVAEVARLVFTYAWHLAHTQGAAARLCLGMSGTCAALIAGHTLCQIQALAATHSAWLRPRWPTRVTAWRELLLAAANGDDAAFERARLRGFALLAAEARLGAAGRA
jgi:hypothetical protein